MHAGHLFVFYLLIFSTETNHRTSKSICEFQMWTARRLSEKQNSETSKDSSDCFPGRRHSSDCFFDRRQSKPVLGLRCISQILGANEAGAENESRPERAFCLIPPNQRRPALMLRGGTHDEIVSPANTQNCSISGAGEWIDKDMSKTVDGNEAPSLETSGGNQSSAAAPFGSSVKAIQDRQQEAEYPAAFVHPADTKPAPVQREAPRISYNLSLIQSVDTECRPGVRCIVRRDQVQHCGEGSERKHRERRRAIRSAPTARRPHGGIDALGLLRLNLARRRQGRLGHGDMPAGWGSWCGPAARPEAECGDSGWSNSTGRWRTGSIRAAAVLSLSLSLSL